MKARDEKCEVSVVEFGNTSMEEKYSDNTRYAKLRPFGNAKSKNESVLLLKNTSTTGDQKAESEPLVKRSFAKKRQCSPLVETENIGGSGSTSIKRIKSPFPVEDGHLTVMSGELQIVFIYDTLSVRKEEDDPKDAILYFHPDCIPEERRIAICGQLMGITHFLIDTFSAPKILTLDNGKFAMRKFGRQYVLALGCSSVTPDWLLEKQADILYNITIFFHRDIKTILHGVNDDRTLLSSKLSLIMDHYIPISQHHGDLFALTFGILPILNLPKSASNISLSAAVVLQSCLMQNGVLGGIVMYQNKVLGVELAQELAQKLSFIQPYQLPPAEPVRLQYPCPPGVQMFTVFVSEEELEKLRKHSSTFQQPSHFEPKVPASNENNHKGKFVAIREEEDPTDSSSLGFSEPSSKDLKGSKSSELDDTAKILVSAGINSKNNGNTDTETISASKDAKLKFEEFLKSKSTAVSHANLQPVDQNDNTKKGAIRENLIAVPPPCVHMNGCGPNSLNSSRVFKSLENMHIADDNSAEKTTPPPPLGSCFCASLTDPYFPFIRCDGKSISKALLDVYAGTDESNQTNEEDKENETEVDPVPPTENEVSEVPSDPPARATPPINCFPGPDESTMREKSNIVPANDKKRILNFNEKSVDEQLANTISNSIPAPRRPMDLPLNNKKYSRKKSKRRWSTFEDMMSPVVDTPSRVSESFPAVLPNINENWKNSSEALAAASNNPSHPELLTSFRKISSQDELLNNYAHISSTDNTVKVNGSMSVHSKNPSMSGKKLNQHLSTRGSIIASNKDGSKSHAQHDSENAHSLNKSVDVGRKISSSCSSSSLDTKNHIKSSLFIYSLGSMRLLLLMEKDKCKDSSLIQTLWEYGSSSLSELETAISNVEEQTMSTTASQHDHYCYLHYESVWRSLAHGGRNHSMDFDVVQQMHQDFNVYPNISELIIRGEDHVVYGYQCVGSEVFYQQSAGLQPGLPMPSDLMGKVPFKAKRRLERDHNILLL